MRKKSPTKLQNIIDTAARLFVERGFAHTSMAEIAACVGGSKATLYSYFPSKDKIYFEVLMQSAHKLGDKVFDCLEGDAPLCEKLSKFGKEYLTFVMSQPMIDIRRTFMSEAHKAGLGKMIYECGFKKKWSIVSELMAQAMVFEKMKSGDAWIAAMQFRALLEVDLVDLRILGIIDKATDEQIDVSVKRAVEMFCTYYKIERAAK